MSKEEAFRFMKINIYYGGRGELVDPTMAVLDRMTDVLKSLNVNVDVTRYDIHEHKNQIPTLHQTIEGCDGIILATTVEWLGIGGYMMEFLDSLWLYGNRDQISSIYMQPVVLSTTTGEREAMLTLENAWETLGGPLCEGLCGYVADAAEFSANRDFEKIIEKKAENLYRTLSQKPKALPSSKQAVSQSVQRTQRIILTPQESEQLSQYAVDDRYVKKQKEDIIELSSMYRNLLGGADETQLAALTEYAEAFGLAFQITDDILDVTGDAAAIGKPVGSDERNHKSTYVTLTSLEEAKRLAREAADRAHRALAPLGEKAAFLDELAEYLITRDR